jgi:Tfp pilus assembly protein PilN
MKNINLMPAYRLQAKARKAHLLKWGGGLAVYATLILIGYMICTRYVARDHRELDADARKTTLETNAANRIVTALNEELAQARQQLRTAQAVGQQPDWGTLLGLLANSLGDDVVMDSCRLQPSRVEKPAKPEPGKPGAGGEQITLELTGLARDQADVSAYMLRLEKTGLFDKVKLIKTNRQPFLSDKALAFRLECLIQGREGTPL